MDYDVTIIIPVFNSEKYLTSCLDSALNQKYKRYEILVINGGSTDSSPEILERFAKKAETKDALMNYFAQYEEPLK